MIPLPLAPLQRQLRLLATDLREQATAVPELARWLDKQYGAAHNHRTGATFETWRDEQVDQASVAWLLGTVFVRFCEDNDLIEEPWIAGPGPRTDAAVQAQTAHALNSETVATARDWLRAAFTHLRSLPATTALFDDHNPVWRWPLTADAAAGLLDFWRSGPGVHNFTDPALDTRFLGDVYQDLSVEARKRYALLQTPEFVEEFILDLTLDESLREFGLEDTSLIDPTCGSGHFLLGAFARLLPRWEREHPAMDVRERVQKALDQVTGVDINPFAVAIARFRLLVAALTACDERSLTNAPGFKMRLAAGDSLLKWGWEDSSHQGDILALLETGEAYAYYTEDAEALAQYLRPGQYTVAVGNPPYVTVKDKYLNRKYRVLYPTCSGAYALSVPFIERFFQLVRKNSNGPGIVGQITANSFMKREFGKKLIEEFFVKDVELIRVIDTSGAYIPGHGTPTLVFTGRRRPPSSGPVRAILGMLGEPAQPADPANGLVWTAIREGVQNPGSQRPYVSAVDLPRSALAYYPWSLVGGGAIELQAAIAAKGRQQLRRSVSLIGFMAVTREDDAYFVNLATAQRKGVRDEWRPVGEGVGVRDWVQHSGNGILFPYSEDGLSPNSSGRLTRLLWPNRRLLELRRALSGSHEERGLPWFTYSDFHPGRWSSPLVIAFAFVQTHNHFVLARGGCLYTRSAPVIKLPEGATEDDHLRLLGLLNSSTACFWLKQVSHDKGNRGGERSTARYAWENFFEFTGTKLQEFPVPRDFPLERARALDRLAAELGTEGPGSVAERETPTRGVLNSARERFGSIRGRMIAVQEELDWEVYRMYGLLDEELTVPGANLPRLSLGERAFEIVLARKVESGEASTEWFARHGSTPITEIPEEWPQAYKEVVARRIEVIESRPDIALIERPECKRRWAAESWEVQEKRALRDWLLDRLEAEELWRGPEAGRPMSVAVLADRAGGDADFRSVLTVYCGRDDYDLAVELTKLVADEAVPFLAAYRYKASGLEKRLQWERTWDLQRDEDNGEPVGPIPVPPKYAQGDFAKVSYWRNRGKLDVPKERFIAYPNAGRDSDRSPVIGWAGWDHAEQAQALATLYVERKLSDGWPVDKLLPLLAGLHELEPWLEQWHSKAAPGYPGGPASYYTTLIDAELAAHGADRADIALGILP